MNEKKRIISGKQQVVPWMKPFACSKLLTDQVEKAADAQDKTQ